MGFFCILATALLLGINSANANPLNQSKLATKFRIFTDKKGRTIKAAPLSLYTYGPWERSWLELLMTNNSKSKVRVTLLTEADQEYLKEWAQEQLHGLAAPLPSGVILLVLMIGFEPAVAAWI